MEPSLRESIGIDFAFGMREDSQGLFADVRERVIERVESGASRREAAEEYDVSPSTAQQLRR